MKQTVLVLLALICGSHQQCLTANDTEHELSKEEVLSLALGEQDFSVSLLKVLASSRPAGNLIFSPYSTYQALLLAYFGAANQTEKLLKSALRIPPAQSKLTTVEAYSRSKFRANISDAYILKSSNRIYLSDKLKLRPCLADKFKKELQAIDYQSDVLAAQRTINAWVEEQTEGQIKNFIDQLSAGSSATLVNAAYFKGKWQYRFRSEDTNKAAFYVTPSKQVQVEMMKQIGPFSYFFSAELGAHVLELPYKGEDVSMFVLLPRNQKEKDVDDVIAKMNAKILNEITDPKNIFPDTEIMVQIPKFTTESRLRMDEALEALRVGGILSDSADFSGFTGSPEVSFNGALHQAKIEVTEEGTRAAAATGVGVFLSISRSPPFFVCNRPFAYFLYDRKSLNVLFMGVFRAPSK